ncbi:MULTISPECIES: DUF6183 family protein [unclassified Streptomyces]|uniref:DUF6183 family protein n=1 Tax=unclassified Streptomyces TaxID=2593676 RepID=UPI00343BCD28
MPGRVSTRSWGCPAAYPSEAVRRATDHRWLRFMAFTDWFHQDASDLVFAVLDPARTRVAVLAATDIRVHPYAIGWRAVVPGAFFAPVLRGR